MVSTHWSLWMIDLVRTLWTVLPSSKPILWLIVLVAGLGGCHTPETMERFEREMAWADILRENGDDCDTAALALDWFYRQNHVEIVAVKSQSRAGVGAPSLEIMLRHKVNEMAYGVLRIGQDMRAQRQHAVRVITEVRNRCYPTNSEFRMAFAQFF